MGQYLRKEKQYMIAIPEGRSISELLDNSSLNHNDNRYITNQFEITQNSTFSSHYEDSHFTLGEAVFATTITVFVYCGILGGLYYTGIISPESSSTGYTAGFSHRSFEM